MKKKNSSNYSAISFKCCFQRKNYADEQLILHQSQRGLKQLTSVSAMGGYFQKQEIISLKTAIAFTILSLRQCEITVEGQRGFTNESQGNCLLPLHLHDKILEKRGAPGQIAWLTLLLSSRAFAPSLPLRLCRLDWCDGTKTLTPCFNK